jgi:hypothetical protein
MIELEGTEEIGPRMRQAKHLRWPDDTISRRTNHSEKGKLDSFLTLAEPDIWIFHTSTHLVMRLFSSSRTTEIDPLTSNRP